MTLAVNYVANGPDIQVDGKSRFRLAPAHNFDAPQNMASVSESAGEVVNGEHVENLVKNVERGFRA